jgi:hypothetical protein
MLTTQESYTNSGQLHCMNLRHLLIFYVDSLCYNYCMEQLMSRSRETYVHVTLWDLFRSEITRAFCHNKDDICSLRTLYKILINILNTINKYISKYIYISVHSFCITCLQYKLMRRRRNSLLISGATVVCIRLPLPAGAWCFKSWYKLIHQLLPWLYKILRLLLSVFKKYTSALSTHLRDATAIAHVSIIRYRNYSRLYEMRPALGT